MLIKILVLAAIIERVWEHLQQIIGDKHLSLQAKLLGSAVLSIAAAVSLQLDLLFALQVMDTVTLPGIILTGIIIGLGSNVIHDLIDIINGLSAKIKPGEARW